MGLADLLSQRSHDFEDTDFVGWDDAPPRVCYLFYDAARFHTEADRNTLRNMIPPGERIHNWQLHATTLDKLPTRMRAYGANHADRFREQGFIFDAARPEPTTGGPARTALSARAWDALLANAVLADAVVYAWQKVAGTNVGGAIFSDLTRDVFTPIIGRTHRGDTTRGTTVLVEHQGLLVAPRKFTAPCIAYPADPLVWDSATGRGRDRNRMRLWTSDKRGILRSRARCEIRAWSNHLGEAFSIDGVALSMAQTLGLLRIQATDWHLREKTGYVMSGLPEYGDDDRACDTKEEYVRQDFERVGNDLKPAASIGFIMPSINRPPISGLLDVYSFMAGGVGLQAAGSRLHEDWRMYRQTYNYQEGVLNRFANWIGELRRFHRARLTAASAKLIRSFMVNERNDITELDLRAPYGGTRAVLRAQFPDAVWIELLAAAENLPGCQHIDVHYRWNDNPLDPIEIEREGDKFVISGPLLPITEQSHARWAQRAQLFRQQRRLTI